MSLPNRRMRSASALCTFIIEDFWTEIGLKLYLEFLVFDQIVLVFVEVSSYFHRNFRNRDIFKILYLL